MTGAICRKTLYNILGALILFLGGASQYGLALAQNKVTDPLGNQLMSIALSLIVTIFNFFILQFLVYTSQRERNETLT
jgi:phosphotransferase system  glucose/maltose/N-acetylglucosamine-specific IIC component